MINFKWGEGISDKATNTIGSWAFICIQLFIIISWIIWNTYGFLKFDPFPFIFLNLALSFQAAFTAPIIMMSQNRQAIRDRQVQIRDFEVNKLAENEIRTIVTHLKDVTDRLDTIINSNKN
jgi:uncharacterized membrane protein